MLYVVSHVDVLWSGPSSELREEENAMRISDWNRLCVSLRWPNNSKPAESGEDEKATVI